MTEVVLDEAGLNTLLRNPEGQVGRYIDVKARDVQVRASINASGRPGPDIRTGTLQSRLRYPGLIADEEGMVALVGTDARSPRQNFNYPAALEIGMPAFAPLRVYEDGHVQKPYHYPWLVPALRDAFA